MSLYTPIFSTVNQRPDAARGGSAGISISTPKGQNYIELLRDVHLFLSTQGELLSPPSRPSSPDFDTRVQNLRNSIQDAFDAAGGEPASGKWTHVSEKLRLGCARGRYWQDRSEVQRGSEEDAEWILPDEEQVWIEWEREREERRRQKGKGKAPQQVGSVVCPIASAAVPPDHANLTELGKSQDPAPIGAVSAVSPATLLQAQEKVRSWQAMLVSEDFSDAGESHTPPLPSMGVVRPTLKGKASGQEKNHSSLGFPVVKRAVGTSAGKKSKGGPSVPGSPRHRRDLPRPTLTLQPPSAPLNKEVVHCDRDHMDTPPKASLDPNVVPKIADFPETPYLPPSFPSHLETSTPHPQHEHEVPVRAKPPPIMPLPPSSSTPPPSTPGNPFEGHTHIQQELDKAPSLPLQSDDHQLGQRHRPFSLSPGVPNNILVTPPNKKPRIMSQDRPLNVGLPPVSRESPPNIPQVTTPGPKEGTNVLIAEPGVQKPDVVEAVWKMLSPSRLPDASDINSNAHRSEENPSPAKSTKSHFSFGSDPSNSPISNHNLLLDSPVSPMPFFAQTGSEFHPRYTSTQQRGDSLGRTGSGFFGMGYNSQFDVEKHVDRVSEFLEKDVDFEGWLRDVPAVDGIEASKDQ